MLNHLNTPFDSETNAVEVVFFFIVNSLAHIFLSLAQKSHSWAHIFSEWYQIISSRVHIDIQGVHILPNWTHISNSIE